MKGKLEGNGKKGQKSGAGGWGELVKGKENLSSFASREEHLKRKKEEERE